MQIRLKPLKLFIPPGNNSVEKTTSLLDLTVSAVFWNGRSYQSGVRPVQCPAPICPNLKIEVTNEENRFNKRTKFVVGVFTSDLRLERK